MNRPTDLREYADRIRKLALVSRHPAMTEHLLRLAGDMDRTAGLRERQEAAETDREAG